MSVVGFKRTYTAPLGLSVAGFPLTSAKYYYPTDAYLRANFTILRTYVLDGYLSCSVADIINYTDADTFLIAVSTGVTSGSGSGTGSGSGGGTVVTDPVGGSATDEMTTDAPSDGNLYMREHGAWVQYQAPVIPADQVSVDAPADSYLYLRQNGAWVKYAVPADAVSVDVPNDGQTYMRVNGAWVVYTAPTAPTGLATDAPTDGKTYLRQNGQWVAYTPPADAVSVDVPTGSALYLRQNGQWVPYVAPVDAVSIDPPNDGFTYLRKNGAWVLYTIPTQTIAADAPADGNNYLRKNGAWTLYTAPSGGTGGIADAPSDGKSYVRLNGAWYAYTPPVAEAPTDAGLYVRKSSAWVAAPIQADAAADSSAYMRQNNTWVKYTPPTQTIATDVPSADGISYVRKNQAWAAAPIQADVPAADGIYYTRRNKAWVADPIQSDTLVDGLTYLRKNGAWLQFTPPVATATAGAYSRRAGFFGDSRIYLSYFSSGQNDFMKGYGIAHWTQAYSKGKIRMSRALSGGVAGDTTSQMLARQAAYITLIKASYVNLVFLLASTNDRTSGFDVATSQRNILAIIRNFNANGIQVVLITETPRGNGSSSYELNTQALKNDHYAMHVWMQTLGSMCILANVWDSMIDTTSSTNYYPLANTVRDGIHPSKIGAQIIGSICGALADKLYGLPGEFLTSNAAYSSSSVMATLTNNPLMTGTTGSFTSAVNATSGSTLATSWSADAQGMTGLQTTWGLETINGISFQKVRIFGTATDANNQPDITIQADTLDLSNLSNGDLVHGTALMRTMGTGLSVASFQMLITPTYSLKNDPDDSDNTLPWPSVDTGVVSRETPEIPFNTSLNNNGIYPRFEIGLMPQGAGIDATVWMAQGGISKYLY